jgi:hypothetical protein
MEVFQGNFIALAALIGYIPFVVCLFALLEPRTAAVYGYIFAWLFLPMSHIPLHGFTDYNKMSAAGFGVLFSAMIFDMETVLSFRPSVWDLPMVALCVCPLLSSVANSSVTNELGWYDGIVSIAYQTTRWGLPYFIGRIYFNDLQGIRELATGIVVGGLLYAPLCWYELRFSPQLHAMLYGFYQHDFGQTRRYGGWRPIVFMQHGLAVALWMTNCAITACWLWWAGVKKSVLGLPMWLVVVLLVVTAGWLHSVGAAVLLVLGLIVSFLTSYTRSPVWIILLSLAPVTYIACRVTGTWNPQSMARLIEGTDERSGSSYSFRVVNEGILLNTALKRPTFGWGGWNRFRSEGERNAVRGVPDQMWIIALGENGVVGLIAFAASLTLPVFLLLKRVPVAHWRHPGAAPAAAMAVLLSLYMWDNLFNAMINPIFVIGAGALTGMQFSMRTGLRASMARPLKMVGPRFGSVPSRPALA